MSSPESSAAGGTIHVLLTERRTTDVHNDHDNPKGPLFQTVAPPGPANHGGGAFPFLQSGVWPTVDASESFSN